MATIVIIGEIVVEIMARQTDQTFLRPGLFTAPYPSGAPAIFADQAARLGASVALIGTVGQDDFGTVNLERLRSSGVDVSSIRRHLSKPTGTAFVTYAGDGSRSFVFNIRDSAASEVGVDQIDPAHFLDCQIFHVMGSSLISESMIATIRYGLALARKAGAQISFDPNIRKELVADPMVGRAISDVLAETDILLPSEADLKYLFPNLPTEEAIAKILSGKTSYVTLKQGSTGCTFYQPGSATHLSAHPTTEVDATGAGDCFGGTFISLLVQGFLPEQALRYANAAGALAVSVQGPMEGNSSLPKLREFLNPNDCPSSAIDDLMQILHRNREQRQHGIYSVCSANMFVLQAACEQAKQDDSILLIEATCNQVNQEGGYTGMTPSQFRDHVHGLCEEMRFPVHRLILGGDHLGPNPWRDQPAEVAMTKALTLVAEFASSGFSKLHLDATMPCRDDPRTLSRHEIAARTARLCEAAEAAVPVAARPPVYIIGTEVPPPGGAQHQPKVSITTRTNVLEMLNTHRKVFADCALQQAFTRVIGVVVQSGVEFADETIVDFEPQQSTELTAFLSEQSGLVFEAHSTDYQTLASLKALICNGFAILKVGPELTFALREALFALARIEEELIPVAHQSKLRDVLETTMLKEPGKWASYYRGTPDQLRIARSFSLSDRIRYYWPHEDVSRALGVLLLNLRSYPPALPLLRQYLPHAAEAVRYGLLENEPVALIRHKIRESLRRYSTACGLSNILPAE